MNLLTIYKNIATSIQCVKIMRRINFDNLTAML